MCFEPAMGVTQLVTRQARPAVETQQHLIAFAKAVDHEVMAVDLHVVLLVGGNFTPHAYIPCVVSAWRVAAVYQVNTTEDAVRP